MSATIIPFPTSSKARPSSPAEAMTIRPAGLGPYRTLDALIDAATEAEIAEMHRRYGGGDYPRGAA